MILSIYACFVAGARTRQRKTDRRRTNRVMESQTESWLDIVKLILYVAGPQILTGPG